MSQLTPREVLTEVVKGLANHPDQVRIEGHVSEHSATFDIYVADEDVGRVLGKKAANAKAMRTLFGAIYGKLGVRMHLQVIDPRR